MYSTIMLEFNTNECVKCVNCVPLNAFAIEKPKDEERKTDVSVN